MAAALPPLRQQLWLQQHQQHQQHQLHRSRWRLSLFARPATASPDDHPARQTPPPELRQETQPLQQQTWHPGQRPRTDEYAWVAQLPGPLAPELLRHVQAEGAATIAALAHTRELQLELQASLNAWKLAAALQLAEDDDNDNGEKNDSSTSSTPDRSVQPDWMAGQGSLRSTHQRSFGPLPGAQVQQHHFFSLPAAAAKGARRGGRQPLLHYCAPVQRPPAAGADAQGLPCGAVLCWSEAAAGGGSVHSLAVSPDGRFLAVTHTPPPPTPATGQPTAPASAAGSALQLCVIDCSTGQHAAGPVDGVDGPIMWVQQPQEQEQLSQTQPQQQHDGQALPPPMPLQHLVFVSCDRLEVHCLDLPRAAPSGAATDAGALADAPAAAPPAPRCLFQDPQHVGVSLAAAGPLTMILVHAADGLPRQLLLCTTTAQGDLAWQELLLPPDGSDITTSTTTGTASSADDYASVRLVPSVAGSWLLVRRSSAAVPEGQLYLARLSPHPRPQTPAAAAAGAASGASAPPLQLQPPLLLRPPQQQPGWLMEATFLSCCQTGPHFNPNVLQLLVLSSCCQLEPSMAGNTQQTPRPLQPARQLLRADCYELHTGPEDASQKQPQQLQVRHVHGALLHLPDLFWQLASGDWRPQHGQLELAWSSLVTPLTRTTISLRQQQQQPEQQPEQQLKQALAPGFNGDVYASVQLAVPPPAGTPDSAGAVDVPLSLAWRRDAATSPTLHALATARDVAVLAPASQGCQDSSAAPPMLLACYGSYGIRESVLFDPELLQLLDRGWVVGVAHVRGGGWLGAAWAEAGRARGKPRSIQDLLQVAAYVQQEGICGHGRLFVQGASAGGWLAAAAMLQAPPAMFAGAVLTVPCCDPLGLLLHQQQGRIELGDAVADAVVLESIRAWAPYDVLGQQLQHAMHSTGDARQLQERQAAVLPRVLVRAAMFDEEVPVHDPVRFTARLRRLHRARDAMLQVSCAGGGSNHSDACAGVLLRVVPGGHTAFQGDVRESALKLAFLLTAASAILA